jgi:DNA-binding GntR family transcriptional regulator
MQKSYKAFEMCEKPTDMEPDMADRIGIGDSAEPQEAPPTPPKRRPGRPRLATSGETAPALRRGAAWVDRAALHARAAERLRAMIVRGELAPGEAIGEAELCAALGMSRTPLREALKLLAAEGLVDLRANRSARVAPLRAEETDELFEAVAGIERIAAELAARRADARALRGLRALQDRIERHHGRGELADYFALNQRIHQEIVAAAGNAALAAAHGSLLARAERARLFAVAASSARWSESVDEHREILAALEARNAERAGRALEQHVLRTGEVVRAALRSPATSGNDEEGATRCAS